MISITFALIIAMQVPITLELDEKVHWEKTVLSMPVDIKFIAISKYILTVILAGLAGMLVILLSMAYYGSPDLFYGAASASLVVLYNMIVIPVSYRFGVGVSKYFLLLFVCIPVLASYIFQMFNINFGVIVSELDRPVLYILLFITAAGFTALSVYVSVKALGRRK